MLLKPAIFSRILERQLVIILKDHDLRRVQPTSPEHPPIALDQVLSSWYPGTRQRAERLHHYTCCRVGPGNTFDPTRLI